MSNQLIKTTEQGKENVFPRTRIQDLFDDTSGQKLIDILRSFNMMFVPYLGNKSYTRNQISPELRRQGLWLTYVIDNTVYTEWYGEVAIDDTNWGSDSNWRQGSNALVGDLSISPNGTWVINGEDSGITIKGDKGDSPIIRIHDNKIQVSYDKGVTYEDLNNTPIYTKFRFNSQTNTYQVSYDLGSTWQDISNEKVYHKFRYNSATNTYQESVDFGKTWSNISAEKVYYQFRYNAETNTHQVSTDLGQNWTDVSSNKVYYQFRTNDNRLQVSTDLGTTWENCSEPIAAWFRWADTSGVGNVGKVQISRDNNTWEDLSPTMTNNLYIKGYVAAVGNLPSNAAIGDIYMVGPTYDESDATQKYPHYRMWVKQSNGWVDNGEYTSVLPKVVQVRGNDEGAVMSQSSITKELNTIDYNFSHFWDNIYKSVLFESFTPQTIMLSDIIKEFYIDTSRIDASSLMISISYIYKTKTGYFISLRWGNNLSELERNANSGKDFTQTFKLNQEYLAFIFTGNDKTIDVNGYIIFDVNKLHRYLLKYGKDAGWATELTIGTKDGLLDVHNNNNVDNPIYNKYFEDITQYTSVPDICLRETTTTQISDINNNNIVYVKDQIELENAINNNSEVTVILTNDILITKGIDISNKNCVIIGNNHKIISLDLTDELSEYSTQTHKAKLLGFPCTDGNKNYTNYRLISQYGEVYDLNCSDWYTSEELIVTDNGEVATKQGIHKVKVPNNFPYTKDEIVNKCIQYFAWYRCLTGRIINFEENYIYFYHYETNLTANAEQIFNNKNMPHFRIYGLQSINKPYINYVNDIGWIWYIPKNLELGIPTSIFNNSNSSSNLKILDAKIIGSLKLGNINTLIIKNCKIYNILQGIYLITANNVLIDNCKFQNILQEAIRIFNGTNCIVSNCHFNNVCAGKDNYSAIEAHSDNIWIHHNNFINYGYAGIKIGDHWTSNKLQHSSSLIEYNTLSQDLEYFQNARDNVCMDSGAIHLYTFHSTENYAVVRFNNIHHYNSRGSGRGIFCDDGCSYAAIYANCVSYIPTSYSIDIRHDNVSESLPHNRNNGRIIVNNIIDKSLKFELGNDSTEKESTCHGNLFISPKKDNSIITVTEGSLYYDVYKNINSTGYFTDSGIPITDKITEQHKSDYSVQF